MKIPRWMAEFERRGGRLTILDAGIDDIEACARRSDLVIVAAGKGEIVRLFERDAEKVALRHAATGFGADLRHRHGAAPGHSAVCFNLIPASANISASRR